MLAIEVVAVADARVGSESADAAEAGCELARKERGLQVRSGMTHSLVSDLGEQKRDSMSPSTPLRSGALRSCMLRLREFCSRAWRRLVSSCCIRGDSWPLEGGPFVCTLVWSRSRARSSDGVQRRVDRFAEFACEADCICTELLASAATL